jgi:predicted dehydrogenase
MKTPRFLVASLGSIGRRHVDNLRALYPTANIAVLRTNSGATTDPCPVTGVNHQFTDLDQAVAFAPQAAVIASPATERLRIAQALVSAGIPVLMEKPIAHTTRGLHILLDEAARRQVPLAVGYNLRFLPSLQKTRALLTDCAIGQLLCVRAEVGQYLPDWRPSSDYSQSVSARNELGGGALLELSHEIDYIYWLLGLPARVTARGGRVSDLRIDVEDVVELCLDYDRPRRLVNIHLDFVQRVVHRSCRFIGTEGTLVWNAVEHSISLYTTAQRCWQQIQAPLVDRNQMYLDEITSFLDFAQGRPSPIARAHEGYDVLAVVEAARTSMSTNKTVGVVGYATG